MPLILMLQPEALIAEITAFRLELLGYQVHTVESAAAAETFLNATVPDLILLDMQLPGKSSLTFCERVGNNAAWNQIPLLGMLLDGDLENVQKAFQAGIQDLILIPFDPSVLEEKILHLIQPKDSPATTLPTGGITRGISN
ncbi:MAG: response regulator [Pirellulales bacterium]|nr:response regulator [Pirellulales bacterium]